jgi:hypothetical protein
VPISKVAVPVKFSDYRPINLFACLSNLFEVFMARQMEAHIRRNELLTVFQSSFHRHHSTTAAVLKVLKVIRSNMEDGQVTVLVLLDFSQAFLMVIHGMLLCLLMNLQNYLDGARMLVDSYLNDRTHFVRCGEKDSLPLGGCCVVFRRGQSLIHFYLFLILCFDLCLICLICFIAFVSICI